MSQETNSHNKHLKVLDLDKYEFDDQDINDRWQTEVEEQLTYQFEKARQQSVQYRDKINQSRERFVTSAAHNTVLVDGDRGTGKSYFLRNIEVAWHDSQQVQENSNLTTRLHFCRVIDPTLLNHHDNFSNVVIAHLYNEVREQQQQNYLNEDFNRTLRELAEALEATDGVSPPAGIDRIIGYRSAVDIELRFHRFIAACLQELGVDMLVLPIDDVDMELSRAHEVLEEIRRLLSCPMILPVVSGNIELFQELMTSHFHCGAGGKKGDLGEEVALQLAKDYLIKVFPENSRMSLKSLDFFCDDLEIKQSNGEHVQFSDYELALNSAIFPFSRQLWNQAYTRAKSARRLVQQIKSIRPSLLTKVLDTHLNAEIGVKDSFWHLVANVAANNEMGTAYMTADAEQRLYRAHSAFERMETDYLLPALRFLPLFDVKLQGQEDASWKKRVFKSKNGNVIRTFTQFPPPLTVDTKAYITKQQMKELPPDLTSLLTFEQTFSRASVSRNYLTYGRLFEILIITLLFPCEREGINEIELQSKTMRWLYKLAIFFPFYTAKQTEIGDEGLDIDETEIENSTVKDFEPFARKLILWEREHSTVLKQARVIGLSSICYTVFQRVFTELDELKKLEFRSKDSLQSYLRRFEYIVTNAFGINLSSMPPLHSRVGVSDARNYESEVGGKPAVERLPAIRRNVFGLTGNYTVIDDRKVFSNEPGISLEANLLQCIWNHPIFTCMTKWTNKEILVGGKRKANEFIEFYQLFTDSLLEKRRKYVTSALYEFLGARYGFEVEVFRTAGKSGINALRKELLSPNYRDLDTSHGEVSRQANVYLKHLDTINIVVTEEHDCGGLAFYAQSDLLKDYCALVERAMQEEVNANSAD